MRIFLIRHGDASGRLTPVGQGQIERTADFLKSLGLETSKTALLTSQLPRAIETAEIISKTMNLLEEVLLKSWLTNGTNENTAMNLAEFTANHPDLVAVIAVSHMPEIEDLLRNLGFYGSARNGSVHEVDFSTKTANRLFVP